MQTPSLLTPTHSLSPPTSPLPPSPRSYPIRRLFVRGLVRQLASPALLAASYTGDAAAVATAAVAELEPALVRTGVRACVLFWFHRWLLLRAQGHRRLLLSAQGGDGEAVGAAAHIPRSRSTLVQGGWAARCLRTLLHLVCLHRPHTIR